MAVTLRKLLARRAGLLAADTDAAFQQQLAGSAYARRLLAYLEEITDDPTLAAPTTWADGPLDANRVAEYLEDAISDEEAVEFEADCMPSPTRFAELVDCHRMLAAVLLEQVDVDPAPIYRRIVTLGQLEEAPQWLLDRDDLRGDEHLDAGPTPNGMPQSISAGGDAGSDQPAGDGKSQPGRRVTWIVATVAAALLLLVIVPVGLIGWRSSGADQIAGGVESGRRRGAVREPGSRPLAVRQRSELSPEQESQQPGQPSAAGEAALRAAHDRAAGVATEPEQATDPPQRRPDEPPNQPAAGGSADLPDANVDDEPSRRSNPTDPPPAQPASGGRALQGANPELTARGDRSPLPAQSRTRPAPPVPPVPNPWPAPQPVESLGRLTGAQQLLLVNDQAGGPWRRAPRDAEVFSGHELISLPGCRPVLKLNSGLEVTLVGPTRLTLGSPGPGRPLACYLSHGRLLVSTRRSRRFMIDFQSGRRTVVLKSSGSAAAVEVVDWITPGVDPRTQAGERRGSVWSTRGRLDVAPAAGKPLSLALGERVRIKPTGDVVKQSRLPAGGLAPWLNRAAARLAAELDPDADAVAALRAAAGEADDLGGLATQSLVLFDEYLPAVTTLKNPKFELYWFANLTALRLRATQHPHYAARIHQAFVATDPKAADELFRMFYAYSQPQLTQGVGRQLVERLDHPELAYRVLAFDNLRQITGSTLLYRPAAPPAMRKGRVAAWKQRLEKHGIAYLDPPQ